MKNIYRINPQMLGPGATMEQAEQAAEWLNAHGVECETTEDQGAINYGLDADAQPNESQWQQMLDEVFG